MWPLHWTPTRQPVEQETLIPCAIHVFTRTYVNQSMKFGRMEMAIDYRSSPLNLKGQLDVIMGQKSS